MNAGLTAVYVGLLGIALLSPYLAGSKTLTGPANKVLAYVPVASGLTMATASLLLRGGLIFPLAPLLLIAFLRCGKLVMAGSFIAIILFAPVPWWNSNLMTLPLWQWAAFGILTAGVVAAARSALNATDDLPAKSPRLEYMIAFIVSVACALGLGMYSAALTQYFPAYIAWHHWGAYLSPVEALLAGGIPFQDFPVQYGIGPTLLIAAFCKTDCWTPMFHIVLVANALYCGALVICALILTADHNRILRIIAATAMVAAAMLWTAFPSDFGTALATPSVAGLRFLPLVCLLLFILNAEKNSQLPRITGYAIWVFNLFWSIEAAAFATLLWWAWLSVQTIQAQPQKGWFGPLVRHAFTAGASTTAVGLALLTLFWLAFGTLPEFSSIIAYIQNPPGAVAPNLAGPVWLAVLFAIMAITTVLRGRQFRNGPLFVCLITMVVTFSYYLSRAHDNNVLNLFPFMVLVALNLLPHPAQQTEAESQFRLGFCMTFLMSVIVFVASFNFWVWEKVVASENIAQTGPAPLLRQVAADGLYADPLISRDAAALIKEARTQSDSAPLLFDEAALMPFSAAGSGWTGVNNVANYSPLPHRLVGSYVRRGAARYKRAGWIIVEETKYNKWVGLFSASYEVSKIKRRGRYAAYFMTPKKLPAVP